MRIIQLSVVISVFFASPSFSQVIAQVKDRLNTPKVIFVPGVLGSRLIDEKNNLIWGTLTKSDPGLFYDPNKPVVSEPLDFVSIFGIRLRQHTYGTFLDSQLQNLSTAENFRPFSYDWRASTKVSSRKLANFICNENVEGQPIVIVAHSMGGLLVKRWLMNEYSTGCDQETLNIQRIVLVATPHLGAPKAFSSLILGADLFGFSAVDSILSKGINEFGLSFDSTYELLPFLSSYIEDGGIKRRCFSQNQFARFQNRVLFKASDRTDYETLDIFSVSVLERLGVLGRIERMLQKVGKQHISSKDYLGRKLISARNAICDLAAFQPPESLVGKITYFYGNLRTENTINTTTVGQVVISNSKIPLARPEGTIDDALYPDQRFYVYINGEAGDGTVPATIAADPMKNGASQPRFGNSTHLGLLSEVGFREFTSAMLSQDYTEEARVKLQNLGWEGVDFTSPTTALAAQAIESSNDLEWDFVRGLPPIEEVVTDGRINLSAFRHASPGSDLKFRANLSEDEKNLYGTVWDASAWDFILAGQHQNNANNVYLYAQAKPSAENWYLAGSIAGLEDFKTAEALAYAGGEYMARGDYATAKQIYSETGRLMMNPTIASRVSDDAFIKFRAGSRLLDIYSGTFESLPVGESAPNLSIDYSDVITYAADTDAARRAFEELNSLFVVIPNVAIDPNNISDTFRGKFD